MIRGIGTFLIVIGVLDLLMPGGDASADFVLIVLGLLIRGLGRTSYDWMRPAPRDRPTTYYDDAPAQVGRQDEPCEETGKVKYRDLHEAQRKVALNQARYDEGEVEYRLERAYCCEFCGWWHGTSQPLRR